MDSQDPLRKGVRRSCSRRSVQFFSHRPSGGRVSLSGVVVGTGVHGSGRHRLRPYGTPSLLHVVLGALSSDLSDASLIQRV